MSFRKNGYVARIAVAACSLMLAIGLAPSSVFAAPDAGGFTPSEMPASGTYSIGGSGYTTGMYAPDEVDFPSYVVVDGDEAWLVSRSYAPNKYDAIWKGKRSEAPEDAQAADVIHAQFIEDVGGAYAAGGTYAANIKIINGISCKAAQFVIPLTEEELADGKVYFVLRRASWSESNPGKWMGTGDHYFEFGALTKISDATDVPGRTKLVDGTYALPELTASYSTFQLDAGKQLLAPYLVVRGASSWLVVTSGNTQFDQILLGQRPSGDGVEGIPGGPVYKAGMSNLDGDPTVSADGMTFVLPIPTEDVAAAVDDDSDEDVHFALRRGTYISGPYAGKWAAGTYYFTLGELERTSDSTAIPTITPYVEPPRPVTLTLAIADTTGAAVSGATITMVDENGETIAANADGTFSLYTQTMYHCTVSAAGYDADAQWFTMSDDETISVTLYAQGTKPLVELDSANTELMYGVVNTQLETVDGQTYLLFAMRTTGYPNLYYGSIDEALAATAAQGKAAWTYASSVPVHEYYLDLNGARVDSKAAKVQHHQFRLPIELDPSGVTRVAFVSIAQGPVNKAEDEAAATGKPVDYSPAFFYRQALVDLNAGTVTYGNYCNEGPLAVTSNVVAVPVANTGTLYTMGTPNNNEYIFRPTMTLTGSAYDQAFAGSATDAAATGAATVAIGADGSFTVEYVNTLAEGTSERIITISDDKPAALSLHDSTNDVWIELKLAGSFATSSVVLDVADDVAAVESAIAALPNADAMTEAGAAQVMAAKAAYEALPAGQKLLVSAASKARLDALVEVAEGFAAAQAQRDASAFEALVDALPSPQAATSENAADVAAARAAYEALSDAAKALVSDEALAKLIALEDAVTRIGLLPVNEENMFVAVNVSIVGSGSNTRLTVSLNGSGYDFAYAGTRDEALAELDAVKAAYADKETAGNMIYRELRDVDVTYREAFLLTYTTNDVARGIQSKKTFELPITDADALAAIAAGTGTFRIPITAVSSGKVSDGDWNAALTPRQVVVDLDAKTATVGNYVTDVSARVSCTATTIPFVQTGMIGVSGGPTSNNRGFILDFTVGDGAFDQAFVGTASAAQTAAAGIVTAGSDGAFTLPIYNVRNMTPQYDAETGVATVSFHVASSAAFAEAGTWVEGTVTVDPDAGTIVFALPELTPTADPAVAAVEALIEALPAPNALTLDDKTQVAAARAAIDALADAQEAKVSADAKAKLAACEARIAELEETAATPIIKRICGENYANETAAAISGEVFEASEWVVLARDDDFADALGATGVAGALGCPIILTDRMALSDAAASEIKRLGATKCYIIGGTGAMKAQLETDLKANGVTFTDRLWGDNSYDTSLACAKKIVDLGGKNDEAIIAMSTNFQDALSMSSYAYKFKVPVVLQTWGATSADRGFTADARTWLSGKHLIVAGGPGAISDASVASFTVTARLYGDSGYDTSNKIAEWMCAQGYLDPKTVILACGAQNPKGVDALAGAALGGKLSAPMLLVNTNTAMEDSDTTTVDGFLTARASDVRTAYVLGGAYVMPDGIYNRIKSMIGA